MSRMRRIALILRTLPRLGARSLWRVGWYRIRMTLGFHPALKLQATPVAGAFFFENLSENIVRRPVETNLFGWNRILRHQPPDWHAACDDPARFLSANIYWGHAHRTAALQSLDIKKIWELSRFSWAMPLATKAAAGDQSALATLEDWLQDWVRHNKPFYGANWACGQEVAVRVMHLLCCLYILGQHQSPTPGMKALLRQKLERVYTTIDYAVGQDNNHGSSEAAALFAGAVLLKQVSPREAQCWYKTGRRLLEERAAVLFLPDGASNQYSVNYHRTVLDTYCFCEIWRRIWDLPPFSDVLYQSLRRAVVWLWAHTDEQTGKTPNLGANDGSHLCNIADLPYQDYRGTVQLGGILFHGACFYAQDGTWNAPQQAWDIERPSKIYDTPPPALFTDGGTVIVRNADVTAYLRSSQYRYRPAQADGLHLDLWRAGRNLLCDSGSFSYMAPDHFYFSGTRAHNTVELNNTDQMPRIGTFLFGDWPECDIETIKSPEGTDTLHKIIATQRFRNGTIHERQVELLPDRLVCTDSLSGPVNNAILRWHLAPDASWELDGDSVTDMTCRIQVTTSDGRSMVPILQNGRRALYYGNAETLRVATYTVDPAVPVRTTILFL